MIGSWLEWDKRNRTKVDEKTRELKEEMAHEEHFREEPDEIREEIQKLQKKKSAKATLDHFLPPLPEKSRRVINDEFTIYDLRTLLARWRLENTIRQRATS